MSPPPPIGPIPMLRLPVADFGSVLQPCAPLFFTSIMHNSGKEAAGRSPSTGTLLQHTIAIKGNTLFRIRLCHMLITEPVGQPRILHWRSASQLHRRSTRANSTTMSCIDRSKRPSFYRLFAGPLYSLFVALAVLVLIGQCSACEIVDLPQSSYSFSACFGGCATAGSGYVLIQLDSAQAWSTDVMLHIDLFTNGIFFSCVAHKYVFVCVHRSFADK
jgi:hypothetical protein